MYVSNAQYPAIRVVMQHTGEIFTISPMNEPPKQAAAPKKMSVISMFFRRIFSAGG